MRLFKDQIFFDVSTNDMDIALAELTKTVKANMVIKTLCKYLPDYKYNNKSIEKQLSLTTELQLLRSHCSTEEFELMDLIEDTDEII